MEQQNKEIIVNQINRVFPRKVVISPMFGAGIASWMSDEGQRNYDFVEDPAFIEWVENELPDLEYNDIGLFNMNDYFHSILTPIMVATGRWTEEELETIYFGGIRSAQVVTVDGPYRIDEYDGYESITQQEGFDWRT